MVLELPWIAMAFMYVHFSLATSGVEATSKIGAVAGVFGFCSYVFFCNTYRLYPIKVYGIFLVYMLLTVLWAENINFVSVTNYLSSTLSAIFIVSLILDEKRKSYIYIYMMLWPFLVNLYAYTAGVNLTYDLLGLDYHLAETRFSGYIGHPNALVTRLLVPSLLLILLFYNVKIPYRFIYVFLALSALVFSILVTGSKKSVLLGLIPMIWIVYYALKDVANKNQKWKMVPMVAIIFSCLIYLMSSIDFNEISVVSRIEDFWGGEDESTLERSWLVNIAWPLIADSPFFGYGLDQYANVSGVGYYSHNNNIELLVNGGGIGWLMYYSIVICSLKNIYCKGKRSLVFLFIVPVILFLDFTGVTYTDRGSQIFLFSIISIAFSLRKESRSNNVNCHIN